MAAQIVARAIFMRRQRDGLAAGFAGDEDGAKCGDADLAAVVVTSEDEVELVLYCPGKLIGTVSRGLAGGITDGLSAVWGAANRGCGAIVLLRHAGLWRTLDDRRCFPSRQRR